MRIAVAHSQLNTFGGGERCTLELLRRLSQLHEVTLWAGAYVADGTFPELAAFPRHDVSRIGWLHESPRADVVITQAFGAHLLALRHPHTICYIHTLRSPYLQATRRPVLILRNQLDHRAISRASAVLTNSQFTSQHARRRYARDIEVVAPGANSDLFALPENAGAYALYVGRLAPEKGIERLLTWAADLPLDLKVVGAGTPDYVAHLRSIAGGKVQFCGAVTGERLTALYGGCRFLTFVPYEEEFGLAALEAMAAGKPVIAADTGGLAELIHHQKSGYLVRDARDFRAAAHHLLADDVACLRLGTEARRLARMYSWDRFARRIEELCFATVSKE